jgi:hypothetical protein
VSNGTDDWRLAGTGTAAPADPLFPMLVVILAANPRLINLDNAAKLPPVKSGIIAFETKSRSLSQGRH